jgi:hypothetical protein
MPSKSSDVKWVRFQQKMYHINSQNIKLIYTNYKIDSCNKKAPPLAIRGNAARLSSMYIPLEYSKDIYLRRAECGQVFQT